MKGKPCWNALQSVLTAAGGFIGWFFGGADGFLYTLIAFVCLDYLSGVLCAVTEKCLSSAIGFRGICRKALIFILVGVGNLTDLYLLGGGAAIRTAVICFYISNEGISLLENAARLGLPVPDKIRPLLEQLHKAGDEETDPTNVKTEDISKCLTGCPTDCPTDSAATSAEHTDDGGAGTDSRVGEGTHGNDRK